MLKTLFTKEAGHELLDQVEIALDQLTNPSVKGETVMKALKNSRIKYTVEIDGAVKEIPVYSEEEANNWVRQMAGETPLTMTQYWYGSEGNVSAIIPGNTYKNGLKIN